MRNALEQLGQTQQHLLRVLQAEPEGCSIEALRAALNVSRNAVRQHLASLVAQGFVAHGSIVPTRGRPQRRYVLTDVGRELFPRRYVELASGLIREIARSLGEAQLTKLLTRLGDELGRELATKLESASSSERCRAIARAMKDLGYDATAHVKGSSREVHARNCVFHHLAQAHPAVCRLDLAFLARASGEHVEHVECIVRGGGICRFRFSRGNGADGKA